MTDHLSDDALAYHRGGKPGKLEISPTKPLANQYDLSLAYSPGVAAACDAIAETPAEAFSLTARANLVGVISNGTAVLGLGSIGALASKPVMEGKAVLFKKFAGIDVFDIELDEIEPQKFCDAVAAMEPTFGGINLEDIKAPECFQIEAQLKERMSIPVFHDDQHGTAIIVAAAIVNGLELANKAIGDVKLVASGAGAASLACLNLLVSMGLKRENIWVTDIDGVVYDGREASMDEWKAVYAQKTDLRTLNDVIDRADIFLGLSAGGVLKADMVKRMADQPMILALANPNPEITPEDAREAKPDAMICTGRSDYPNQVNNVLCFPYIFRGALDAGARTINEEMKQAAVKAIAALAHEHSSEVAEKAYGGKPGVFGPDQLIPNPFDPRLIQWIAPAVAKAAMETGVADRPITDFAAYDEQLNRFVFRSGFLMKPVFEKARSEPKRVIYAEGEDERILRAAQVVIQEGIAQPILVGRPSVIETRLKRYGLSLKPGVDFEIVNPEDDPRYKDYVETFLERSGRRGVTPSRARTVVRTQPTVIAAVALHRGEADAMICGVEGDFGRHMRQIRNVVGLADGESDFSTVSLLIIKSGAYFLADTYITPNPSAAEVANMTRSTVNQVRRFGLEPKVALLSHSNFGSYDTQSSLKMREALALIKECDPDLAVDGEMHGDAALDEVLRDRVFPNAGFDGAANVLIFPNLDAANIATLLIKVMADALPVGPMLIGAAKPAHILTPSVTARGVVNMTALSVVEAQQRG
ncbi:MAG: NADP-dependent malic enzyme [Pseudomonadota bacterium]